MEQLAISDHVFNKFRKIVYQNSGIALSDEKKEMLCMRVRRNMRRMGISSISDYLEAIENDNSGDEIISLLDAISTNVTSFFREPHHFDELKEQLISMRDRGVNRIRIWSAACSTGEEPYSIAIVASEVFESTLVDWKILATDISTTAIEQAQCGLYEQKSLREINSERINKYFKKNEESDGRRYINDRLKAHVVFRWCNLSNPPFPLKGPLDFVFCRNVMIYFDDTVRIRLLSEIFRVLSDDGMLFVGHAESLTGLIGKFKCVRPTIYNKQRLNK